MCWIADIGPCEQQLAGSVATMRSEVRARIWCYFFRGPVGRAASNSAFSLALSCSTAARTRAIA